MGQAHSLVHNIGAGCSTGSPVSSAVSNLFFCGFFFFFPALGLPCFIWAFSNGCSKQELLLAAVHGILITVASLLWSIGSRHMGSDSCNAQA